MALQVTINGVDQSNIILWKSLVWKPALTSKVDMLTFQLYKYGDRTYTPTIFDEVKFYDGGVLVFGGFILQFSESITGVDRQIYSVACKDYTHTLDRRKVVERYTEKPLINIVCDILNRYVNKGSRIEIATFETNEIWQGDGVVDTVNYRVGDQARKLTSTNTATKQMWRDFKLNLAPDDYSNSDLIELDIYVDEIANLANVDLYIVHPNLTDYFTKDITSLITTSGWNFVSVAKSAFTSSGSPSWANVGRIQIVVNSVASETVNVTVDNWQEVKTTAFTRNNTNNITQVVQYIGCNYEEPSKVFQRLANFFQLQWYVDPNKDIHFFGKFDNPSAFNLTDDNGNYVYKSLVVNNEADQIRNVIYVQGADYLSASRNDDLTVQGDGANKVFLLGYKFANYSLTIDGVDQAVGIDNIDGYTDNTGAAQSRSGGTSINVGNTNATFACGQQVMVTKSGKRTKILLRVRKVGTPVDNFQVILYSLDANHLPTAPALSAAANLAGGTITTSYVEYTFTITPTAPGDTVLTEPTSYAIVCLRSGAVNASNYYQVDAVDSGNYEGFPSVYSSTTGLWTVGTANMYFLEKLSYDALYSFNEKILRFDTAPSGADPIIWTGEPYLPTIVRFAEAVSVTAYGEYEYRIVDKTIRTQEGAKQRGLAELRTYAQSLQEVKFVTYQAGLGVGQTINIQSDIRGLDLDLIIMSISAKARSSDAMEYQISCALTSTMGILYWLQEQLAKDNRVVIVDDNELYDRTDTLSETVYASGAWEGELFTGHVWSNDAGTTTNAGQWDGGLSYIWV